MLSKEIDSEESWVESWRLFVEIRENEEEPTEMAPEVADLLRRLMESVFIVHSELADTDLSTVGIESRFAIIFSNNPMVPLLLELDTQNEPIGYILFVAMEAQFLDFYHRCLMSHEVNNFFHVASKLLKLTGFDDEKIKKTIVTEKKRNLMQSKKISHYLVDSITTELLSSGMSYAKCASYVKKHMMFLAAELNEPMPKTALFWMEET